MAIDNDFAVWIKLSDAFRKLREGDETSAEAANLMFERFTNIKQEWRVTGVHALLELFNADLKLVDVDDLFQGELFKESEV